MAVTPETPRWEGLFAARTRGEVGDGIAAVLSLLGVPDLISFAGGFPDPLTFPREQASALLQEFAAAGEVSAFQYAPTRGLAGALDAVAGRLERLQGRRPADDELLITSGSMEALELVGKSFLDRGDVVVVEAPDVPGRDHGVPELRGRGGRSVTGRPRARRRRARDPSRGGLRPKLLYTIPDHQNPAGVSLTRERRERLIDLARRYGFLILEDVAYRELGFEDDAPPSLWSNAPDQVVQAGTTSKTFCPGVRLGWAIAPAAVSAQLVSAEAEHRPVRRRTRPAPLRGIRAAAAGSTSSLRCRARSYRRKCARMLAALERTMPSAAHWTQPRGGFFSWLTLPGGTDAVELARRAVEHKVGIVPGSLFFPDGRGTDNVRLSFSLVDEELIDEGIERLGSLVAG